MESGVENFMVENFMVDVSVVEQFLLALGLKSLGLKSLVLKFPATQCNKYLAEGRQRISVLLDFC